MILSRRKLFSLSAERASTIPVVAERKAMTPAERAASDRWEVKRSIAVAEAGHIIAEQRSATIRRNVAQMLLGLRNLRDCSRVARRTFIATSAAMAISTAAFADTPFTSFAFPGTGQPYSRTTPARIVDIFNVLDYGAIGDGSGALLSSRFGSLGAAQAVYPFVTSLSDTIDWAAIQAAVNAMYATLTKGGTVFVPNGNYVVSQGVDIGNHNIGSTNTNGRIIGSARSSSFINGNLPNGFIVFQGGGVNGPEEVSNLGIANTSTWIGSGGLRLNNSSATFNNVNLGGMIACLFGWDIYNASLNNCTGGCLSDVTTGYNGTLGFAGFTPNIKGWRSTNVMMAAIQVAGSNSAHIDGCGIENCVTAFLLGTYTGWASTCTLVPDTASSILTVAGMMGSGGVSGSPGGNPEFQVGMTLFGRGLNLPAWGSDPNDATGGTTITGNGVPIITDATTTITAGGLMTVNGITKSDVNGVQGAGIVVGALVEGTGVPANTFVLSLGTGAGGVGTYNVTAPGGGGLSARTVTVTGADAGGTKLTGVGYQGTYRTSGNYTISTPIPIWTRSVGLCSGLTVSSIQTEACFHSIYANSVSACQIEGFGFGSNPIECPTQFGGTGLTPRAPFYLRSVTATKISGGAIATAASYLGGVYIDSSLGPSTSGVTFENVTSNKGADNVTNGSITSTVMTITAFTSGVSIGVGMLVFDGVTQVATVTGNHATDNTLTGTNTTGTYRITPSQILGSRTLTIKTGNDWVMPTNAQTKTGLQFNNCTGNSDGLNTLNRTFDSLPGGTSASPYIPLVYGLEFDIVDSNTATWGATVAGGGSNKVRVRYNGTNWTVVGK